MDRRGFCKIIGATCLGVALKPVYDLLNRAPVVDAVTKRDNQVSQGSSWAMVVNMNACKAGDGCTVCSDACHAYHNVPDFGNPKDEIKWIWTAPYETAFPELDHEYQANYLKDTPYILLCNHCDNPPCVKVCPTKATWKTEDGIVMMDYHRCIGCRYCMAACPYGARSFNWIDPREKIKDINPDYPTRFKGVVEKCNFCQERIERDLLPVCVEACPEKALSFGNLNDPESEIRKVLASNRTVRRKPEKGTEPKVFYID